MQYRYGQYDGSPFPTPDSLFPSPQVIRMILQYGQQALDAMEQTEDEQMADLVQQMLDAGLLERDEATGELRLTPRMVRGIEHRSLLEIFQSLQRGTREGHNTLDLGRGADRSDGTKPYEFGDDISELDVHATLRNAMVRGQGAGVRGQESGVRYQESGVTSGDARLGTCDPGPRTPGPGLLPLHLNAGDFEIYHTEGRTDAATCILLDMSGSMMRYGRFFQAKRVALGMASLIRRQFPQDTVDYVGFYSMAQRIAEADLPLIMPKPVSLYDPVVRLRVPLKQAMENQRRVPLHFTNLQMGLRLARQVLSRRGAANKQIFVITDGQPTAHVEGDAAGPGGEMLHLIYPPAEKTATATLHEALRCQQQNIRIATFALIEDYWGMDWVGFVDQLTRLTRGSAFYCSSDDLSGMVIESYLNGKRRKATAK